MRSRFAALVLAVSLAGCTDTTGPVVSVAGLWVYNAENLAHPTGAVCRIEDLQVALTQQGSIVTGNTAGGMLSCQAGSQSAVWVLRNMAVEGVVERYSVALTVDGDIVHAGELRSGRIEGTASWGAEATGAFTMRRR